MSFRKYGGINYSARNNIIKNKYTTTNNLIVTGESNLQNSSTISGPTGPQGIPGSNGFTGLPGSNGVTGPQGVTGPPGTNNSGTSYWGQTGSNIYYTNGNVGIGTNNPQAVLDINNSNNWSLNSSLPSTIMNIAMSSSGQYQTIIGGANYYVSNNYGNTWSQAQSITNIINITSISVSQTGQYQLIAGYVGTGIQNSYVYLSSNYGQTFSMITSLQNISYNFISSQISPNGQTIIFGIEYTIYSSYGVNAYISIDGGNSFNNNISFSNVQGSTNAVMSIAMSQDPSGNYITLVIWQAGIYFTQNGGTSWTFFSNSHNWISVAMSSNGEIQVASEKTSHYVWISTNYGSNWAQMTGTNAYYITSLNISSDGNTITGASNGGYIWQGVNTNGTWIWTEINSTSQGWVSLGISSTLIYQTAISYQTGLYTSNNITLNVTGISQFNGNLLPGEPNTYNLGSPSVPWNSLYVSSNTIHLGNEEDGYAYVSYDKNKPDYRFFSHEGKLLGELFVKEKLDNKETIEYLKEILELKEGSPTGPTGSRGIQGIEGIQGIQGIQGPTGPAISNYTFLQNNSNITNLLSINPSNTDQPENNEINYSNITISSDNNSIDIPGKITVGSHIELKPLDTIPQTNNFPLWINSNDDNNLYLGNKNLEYSTEWINQNLLGVPPQIIANNSISQSTSIYFSWNYPIQIKLSFLPTMVPYINSLYSSYNAVDISMSSLTGIIINNETGNDYIKYDETNTTVQVTAIILIKKNPSYIGNTLVQSGNIYNIQFPSNYGQQRSYIYYDSNLENIIENPSNILNIYYSNYNGHIDDNTKINFNPFLRSYPPSSPDISIKTEEYTDIIINILKPQYGDYVNTTENVKLDKYKIIYNLIENTIRYYDISQNIYNELIVNVDDVVNNTTQISNLYSDTKYSIIAYVKNIYIDEYNNSSYTIYSTTQALEPVIEEIEDISLNIIFNVAKKVLDSSSVTNLYLIDGTSKQSLYTKFPIHEKNNRGTLAGNGVITTISCNIYQSSNVFIEGPSKDLLGFPIQEYSDVNTNGINLSISQPVDSYNIVNQDDINNKNCGYYLESSATVNLENSVFTPSENEYTLQLQRTGLNGNVTTSNCNYFCDLLYSMPPSIGSVVINNIISSVSSYKYVSGIYVFNGIIRLNITVNNVNNIGKYFYNNINILTYNNNNSSSVYSTQLETGLYNVIDDPDGYTKNINQPSINGPITINNTYIYFQPLPSYYSETLIMNVKAYNVLGTYTSQDSVPFSIIIDPLSINLISTQLKQSIDLSVADSSNFSSGFRVWCGQTSENNNLPPILFNNKRYVEYPYDNSWDISSLQELQVCNGKFITKQSSIETGNGYKDYRNSYYNTNSLNNKDYSQIPGVGYRYATFAWNIGNPPNNIVYTKLMVQLINTNVIMKKNESMVYIDNNYTYKVLLYYRFEKKNRSVSIY